MLEPEKPVKVENNTSLQSLSVPTEVNSKGNTQKQEKEKSEADWRTEKKLKEASPSTPRI